MKRLVVALGLAVAATAVQAQTRDERILHPSQENPSLVTALRNWIASKTAPSTTAPKTAPRTATTHAAESHRHYVAENHQRGWHHAHHSKVTEYKVSEANAAPKDAAPRDAAPKDAAPKDAAARADIPKTAAPKVAALQDVAPQEAAPAAAVTLAPAVTPAPSLVPTRSIVPTMTTASAEAAPAPVAPTLAVINPNMPRTVATITVVAPSVSATRPHHGRSECSSGERVITAYYWEGSHTASGERFNPDGYTAAHRTYPFGTKLVVINPRNGKSVTVTVNDRGPFVKGVSLDLSRGAARAIGLQGNAAVCMAKM
jgi:rare lipoprotein A